MRNRTIGLVIGATVIVVAAGFMLFSRGGLRSRTEVTRVGTDSVWYHASDVALLGRTNRPQLVEFFHPG